MEDSGSAPAVSVVIPALNAAGTITRALAALARQDLELPYEVVVVDCASDDDTAKLAAAAEGPVRVLSGPRALPGATRNRGVAASRAPVIAFTDADCFPAPGWLRAGLAAIEDAELVAGPVDADPVTGVGPLDRSLLVEREGMYETANLFVTRRAFDRVGGFEDWLEVKVRTFGEDTLFGWEVRRLGGGTSFRGEARVHHAVFRRGALAYIGERVRLGYVPALLTRIPELRRHYLVAGVFANRVTARFDLALAACAAAVAVRSPLPLLATVPYALPLLRRALLQRKPRSIVLVAAADIAADAVGLASLVAGSLRWRRLVL